MTRTRSWRAALALLSALLGAPPADAIIGGTLVPDGTPADAVVLIAYMGGSAICSGSLIAPTVVLTAATCLPDLVPDNYAVLGGVDPFTAAAFTIAVSAVHRHPDYDAPTFAHDLGVLELASPAPVTPLPWRGENAGVYDPGLSVDFFGYGVTNASTLTGEGKRRTGAAPITTKEADSFLIDASQGQSPCAGDTGGPALPVDAVLGPFLMGVVSYGDQDCAQYASFTRTDANAAFIAQYAPEPSGPAAAGAAAFAIALLRARGVAKRA